MAKIFNQKLGKLEREIMEIIWKLKSASVRQVLNKLKRKFAYTTVMTVMSRLSEKNILKRELKDNSYIYTPFLDKENFSIFASKRAIQNLIKEFGEVAIVQFMDIIEGNDLKEWKKKLRKIK